jgi:hypothetical protein
MPSINQFILAWRQLIKLSGFGSASVVRFGVRFPGLEAVEVLYSIHRVHCVLRDQDISEHFDQRCAYSSIKRLLGRAKALGCHTPKLPRPIDG